MPLRSILGIIGVAIILLLGVYVPYSLFYRPAIHKLSPDMQVIGILDLDNGKDLTLHSIMNGDDEVVVIDHATMLYQQLRQKIPQAQYLSYDELFNINNLHLFDVKNDGLITSKDPIYKHLFVIKFYDNGQQEDIKSLSAAGVKGIYVKNPTSTGEHEVLMADGTQRILFDISKIKKPQAAGVP